MTNQPLRPPLAIALPIPRNADDAAYAFNRLDNADEESFLAIFEALLDIGDDPALADLARILRTDRRIFAEICLQWDICPIHECDFDSCADDGRDCISQF